MNRVVHFDFQANDVKRAKKFYEKVFGWKIEQVMKKEESGMMDYWLIYTGQSGPGINGGMYPRPKEAEDKFYRYSCTIEVKNIDEAISAVKSNGGKVEMEKSELVGVGWFASVKDTEGNQFSLMQPTSQKLK